MQMKFHYLILYVQSSQQHLIPPEQRFFTVDISENQIDNFVKALRPHFF